MWWVFPVVAAVELAVPVGIGLLVSPQHLVFYWGFGLGVVAAFVIVLGDSPPHYIERWRQGAEGEKSTARSLRRLARAGWILVHDIDTGRGNIDHVLAGPQGVFLLDSKHLAGMLSVRQGVLSVRWREDPADGYENRRITARMRMLAAALETRLRDDGVELDRVQAVVVLWGGTFEQGSVLSKDVAWVSGRLLSDVIEQRPGNLSSDQLSRIAESLQRPW